MVRLLASAALGASALIPGAASAAVPTSESAAAPAATIEAVIDAEMPASGVPGLAYAVVADGQVTSVGARGVAERGGDEPVTPDTPFLTGSVSKSFTALAVLQLVEAGRVDLDAEISRYLDGFAGRPAGGATIRELLSHTSGFSTLQGNEAHTDTAGGSDALARQVDQVAETEPAYPPGERWEYSNTNYQVLGRLIEVVSGTDYQDYVTTRILEPVGMANSFVADGEVHESMATGHRPWFGGKRPLAENSTDPQVQIGSYCTVFAMTEILSKIRAGVRPEDLARAALVSVAKRVLETQAITTDVVATGGVVAHNPVMKGILKEILKTEVHIPPHPQHIGAFGAALVAASEHKE